jgi:hypothetical protein
MLSVPEALHGLLFILVLRSAGVNRQVEMIPQLTLGKISNTSGISKTRWPGQGSQAVLENSGSYISGLYDLAFGSYAA